MLNNINIYGKLSITFLIFMFLGTISFLVYVKKIDLITDEIEFWKRKREDLSGKKDNLLNKFTNFEIDYKLDRLNDKLDYEYTTVAQTAVFIFIICVFIIFNQINFSGSESLQSAINILSSIVGAIGITRILKSPFLSFIRFAEKHWWIEILFFVLFYVSFMASFFIVLIILGLLFSYR